MKEIMLDLLKEMAESNGYDLVKKQKKEDSFKKQDPYADKCLTELKEILSHTEGRIQEIETRNQKLSEKINEFMNETPPTDFSRTVYSLNKFIPNRLLLRDSELVELNRKVDYIQHKIKEKTAKDIVNNFELKNTGYRGFIKQIKIEQGNLGDMFEVEVVEPKLKKDDGKDKS